MDYEDNLRERIRKAKEFLAAHEGKASGPYFVRIEVGGWKWGDMIQEIAQCLKRMEQGPDKPMSSSGDGYGGYLYQRFMVYIGDKIEPEWRELIQTRHPEERARRG